MRGMTAACTRCNYRGVQPPPMRGVVVAIRGHCTRHHSHRSKQVGVEAGNANAMSLERVLLLPADVVNAVEAIAEPPSWSSTGIIDSTRREVGFGCITRQEIIVPCVYGGVSEHINRR
ncbi:hypothetical protein B296_00057171 [Ensete ventricosum]|uniref:Uncharacterized protein n=1 Tax=Ensete ventricosum TaxID=4639 RepID=A0A426XSH5_ENSVE|nr:hypothetical protein B296_00057171 [Ensete ventricosum]